MEESCCYTEPNSIEEIQKKKKKKGKLKILVEKE